MNTQIREIAQVYIESATAAQKFEIERHTELFKSADAKFQALIASDSSMYDCPLRDIRYAIVQGNFADAKARFSVLSN